MKTEHVATPEKDDAARDEERFDVVDLGLQLGEPRRFAVWDYSVSRFWKINGHQIWRSIADLNDDFDARWPQSAKFHTVHREQRDRIGAQALALGFSTEET